MRKSVKVTELGRDSYAPVSLLEIEYTDGRRTWGIADGIGLVLFGTRLHEALTYAMRVLK